MDLGLKDKVVLVTGSSSGIGAAIAEAFAFEGARVILNGRHEASLKEMAKTLGREHGYIIGDVSLPGDCDRIYGELMSKWGRLDCLVCNVGSGTSVPPGSETHAEWVKVLDANLFSATNMIERARAMLETRRGNIVCISSICGIEALGAPLTYAAAKAALNSYIVGIARPFGKVGVRINGVAPGNILHPFSVWHRRLEADRAGTEAMLQREVALGRLGTPEDIANMCLFLASDRAAFVTGAVFVADGGQLRS